jgi:alpha-2-macroglobulin
MKRNFFGYAIICILFIGVISACNNKKEKLINAPDFNQLHSAYVSAYTTGLVPRSGSVKVRFMDYVVPKERVGKEEENFCFSFEPSVKGKIFWEDRRTIEFRPSEFLESGQVYNGSLDLSKIFDTISIKETKLPFQFHTKEQSAYVTLGTLVPVTENKINLYYLNGTVVTAETEKPESVEQVISLNKEAKIKIKWFHDKNGTNHRFVIDSLERKEEAYNLLVKWDGEKINADSKGEKTIEIPSLKDFKIIDSETHYEPEQFFVVTFSDPILSNQELKGLIHSASSTFSFLIENNSVKVFPASRLRGDVKIKIEPGIKNIAGHKLRAGSTLTLSVNDIAPQVRLVGNGVIVPDSEGIPFPFEAINLNAVDVQITKIYESNILEFLQFNGLDGSSYLHYVGKVVFENKVPLTTSSSMDLGKWNRHALDLSSLIKTEPGAIYRVSIRFRKDYSLYECSEKPANAAKPNEVVTRSHRYSLWDYYNYYYYDYEAQKNPCKDDYYQNNYGVSRNILVSDLGMIAKRGTDGSILFVVSDLKTAQPVSSVTVDIYDMQKQKIKTIKTNEDGFAYFKSEDAPFVAVAVNGDQKGYLKLSGSQLSFSKFDVDGNQYQKGLKGFIYTERGVWRPGDSIYVNLILEDRQRILPIDHPVVFEMFNPRGQLVQKMMVKESLNGFYSFNTATDLNAQTGTYNVRINVGGALFEKNLKIESIIPNRLKLNFEFDKKYISSDDKTIGTLQAKWLHGAPAGGMKADVTAVFRRAKDIFPAYKEYTFDDPLMSNSIDSKVLFEGMLNEQGNALITNNFEITSGVSGALKVDFFCKVFEPGGNFSTDNFNTIYYPYKKYIGMKLPKGDGDVGVLFTNQEHAIDIVTLNKDGKPVNETVRLEMYKLEWRYWWDYYEDDLGGYNGRYYQSPVDSANIKTVNGKGIWKVKVKEDDYGRFLIRACYPDGHCTGKIVYFDYPGWYSRRPDNTAGTTLLTFSSNKDKYAVGEVATLDIPTGFKGKALVTLENGTSVLKADWIEAKKGKTTYSFTITKDMAPNIYAYVTLLQPHAQSSNDLPIRLYGVIPIHVNNPGSHLKPVITMPEILRPEAKAVISVREETGKKMTYTIAVVDEGLLDLTKFKTPDPWPVFYAKEALQVTTWDLFDQVLGNHSSKIKKLLSIGGDAEESEPGQGSKVQRFKPMVKFIGPFYLEANKSATHTITIPKYVGSVRTMVVAGYAGAYGSAEKTTPVKSPLMVLGTLPRVLGPGEEVMLPVSVFAEEGIKDVSVEVKINNIFSASGPLKQVLTFNKQGEQLLNFPLKVNQELGIAKVQIIARAGKETANYEVELEVRAPNPLVSESTEGILAANTTFAFDYKTFGIKGTNKGSLEISTIPPLNLNQRLEYLIQYPHGCLEQTTSALFPQIALGSLIKLSPMQKRELDYNVNAGLRKMRNFQLTDGGFGYWPG